MATLEDGWDVLCNFCQSVFDDVAVEKLVDGSPDKNSLEDLWEPSLGSKHWTKGQLVASANSGCHLCKLSLLSLHDNHFPSESAKLIDGLVGSDTISEDELIYHRVGRERFRGRIAMGLDCGQRTKIIPLLALSQREICDLRARRLNQAKDFAEERLNQVKLWINESEGSELFIMETETLSGEIVYATLSHCWGSESGIQAWRRTAITSTGSIRLTTSPKLLQEAAWVLAQLQISYLWVDALCIDQDLRSDWETEFTNMGDIYAGAVLNISATAAKNGNYSLFPRPLPVPPCILSFRAKNEVLSDFVAYVDPPWEQEIERAHLNTRGWVFQERLLSPRIVHFARDRLYWECFSSSASETLPETFLYNFQPVKYLAYSSFMARHPNASVYSDWHAMVGLFSKRDLTKPSDKFPAISGLAKHFATQLEISESSYLAGLWEGDLPEALLWTSQQRQNVYHKDRAPSWSWAAVDGEIFYTSRYEVYRGTHTHYLKGSVEHVGNPLAGAARGKILLQGPLCVVHIRHCKMQGSRIHDLDPNSYPFEVPSNAINWDDSSPNKSFGEKTIVFLVVNTEFPSIRLMSCLVLRPVADFVGRFQRVGIVRLRVWSIEDMLSLGRDINRMPQNMFRAHDAENGFTIELV
ncbi:MAG: hypothetical protein Q9227_004568 [Pyrenula ochraceoflavens]